MRIMCCLKPVPKPGSVKIDPKTHTLKREEIELALNPYDRYALEAAVSLAEETDGKVVAVSMAPPNAKNILLDAYAFGADELVLLSDRAFAGADTLATSYTLACAARKLGPFDLIVCGKVSVDGETAQVGPELAAWLGIPSVTWVKSLKPQNGSLELVRVREFGEEVIRAKMPLLVTIENEANIPRPPSIRRLLKRDEVEIKVLSAEDIGAEPAYLGLSGSPTQVVDVFAPEYKGKRELISGPAEEVVDKMISILKERGLI
ncbi:electron transfer flavoprotein subunit beta/FixA family protein [Thermodesulfatator atlanticus]